MGKIRYTIPDALRGFALLEMMIYHALWDMVFIFDYDIGWFRGTGTYIWQQSICWVFIILSGFCSNLSRHKIKRGLTVLICSLIISAATIIVLPEAAVRFGVLCLIASGMLIMIPLDKVLKNISPIPTAVIFFFLFIITKNVPEGFIGVRDIWSVQVPEVIYINDLTAYIGFPTASFNSSDYFPLIPWLFLYITGYFIYHIFRRYDLMRILSAFSIKPLEWIGCHSLIIYMLHQPAIYGLVWLIFNMTSMK